MDSDRKTDERDCLDTENPGGDTKAECDNNKVDNQDLSVTEENKVCAEKELKDSKASETKKGFIQFAKFLGFSLGAGVIEFLSFFLFGLISDNLNWIVAAEIISVVLSCLFNFTFNRKYTFKNSSNIVVGMILYGAFYAITAPLWALAMREVIANIGTQYELLVKAVKMILNFVLDFLYCKFVLFGLANRIAEKLRLKKKK